MTGVVFPLYSRGSDWRAQPMGDTAAAARGPAADWRLPSVRPRRWIPSEAPARDCLQHGSGIYGRRVHAQVCALMSFSAHFGFCYAI